MGRFEINIWVISDIVKKNVLILVIELRNSGISLKLSDLQNNRLGTLNNCILYMTEWNNTKQKTRQKKTQLFNQVVK